MRFFASRRHDNARGRLRSCSCRQIFAKCSSVATSGAVDEQRGRMAEAKRELAAAERLKQARQPV